MNPEPAVVYQPTEYQAPVEPGSAVADPSAEAIASPTTPGVADAVTAPAGSEVAAIPAPETTGMGKIQSLTDAQILKVTETVNSGEIEQAKLAKSKAKSAPVKQFAAHMITQHTKANQQGSKLAKQEQLVPAESPTATEVGIQGAATLEKLKATVPAEFDKTYVDAQVEQHTAVLKMLGDQLIPSASDPALRAQLEEARKMVEQHLSDARTLQGQLGGSTATP